MVEQRRRGVFITRARQRRRQPGGSVMKRSGEGKSERGVACSAPLYVRTVFVTPTGSCFPSVVPQGQGEESSSEEAGDGWEAGWGEGQGQSGALVSLKDLSRVDWHFPPCIKGKEWVVSVGARGSHRLAAQGRSCLFLASLALEPLGGVRPP